MVRILSAMRSAVIPKAGVLRDVGLHDLTAPVIKAALSQAALRSGQVDEVILSNALGAGGNPARLAALAAGLPERVAGLTIDRQCCGGLDALIVGAAMIASGQAGIVVAGGVESYSRRPLRAWPGTKDGRPQPYDRPPFAPGPYADPEMDDAAAELATVLAIPREEQIDWAVRSHEKAMAATSRLSNEIVPIAAAGRDTYTRRLSHRLAERSPVLSGSINVATAAVAADGAAVCVLASDNIAAGSGVEFLGGVTLGGRTDLPGLAPVAAIREVLSRFDLTPPQLAVAEVMEAYAVQAIACVREGELDQGIVNPGGGALARGHPIGASGAINAVRLFHDLRDRRGYGLVTIAAAGGIGSAAVFRA